MALYSIGDTVQITLKDCPLSNPGLVIDVSTRRKVESKPFKVWTYLIFDGMRWSTRVMDYSDCQVSHKKASKISYLIMIGDEQAWAQPTYLKRIEGVS